jgi:hypothetical protein
MARQPAKVLRTGQLAGGAAAVLLLASACGTASGMGVAIAAPSGTVSGKFIRVGGPAGAGGTQPPAVPLRGQIRFTDARHRTFTARAGQQGTFTIVLVTGVYKVVGRTPEIKGQEGNGPLKDASCALPHKVKVTKDHTVKIKVICSVP